MKTFLLYIRAVADLFGSIIGTAGLVWAVCWACDLTWSWDMSIVVWCLPLALAIALGGNMKRKG